MVGFEGRVCHVACSVSSGTESRSGRIPNGVIGTTEPSLKRDQPLGAPERGSSSPHIHASRPADPPTRLIGVDAGLNSQAGVITAALILFAAMDSTGTASIYFQILVRFLFFLLASRGLEPARICGSVAGPATAMALK